MGGAEEKEGVITIIRQKEDLCHFAESLLKGNKHIKRDQRTVSCWR